MAGGDTLHEWADASTGSGTGQGVAGDGSGIDSTPGEAGFSSFGVIKSSGSVNVFFNTSTASCASPESPDVNDFIGK